MDDGLERVAGEVFGLGAVVGWPRGSSRSKEFLKIRWYLLVTEGIHATSSLSVLLSITFRPKSSYESVGLGAGGERYLEFISNEAEIWPFRKFLGVGVSMMVSSAPRS